MRSFIPVNDLNRCSVKGCTGQSAVIIEKKYGEERMMFGYCSFHSIVSATFFAENAEHRREIRI